VSGIDRGLSAALTVAAAVMAVAIVKREFFPASAALPPGATRPALAVFDSSWRSATAHAITVGKSDAPVQIVEFVDFECPVCALIHSGEMHALRDRFGDSLAVRYVHYPLDQHRFARIIAQAVECADRNGRVREMIDHVFLRRDSVGVKTWASFAKDVGITDTLKFARCVAETPQAARIDSGYALATRRDVRGTPTFIVNGWVLGRVPPRGEFERVVNAILAGKDPNK
jgi:protein-disulfide isomerase